MTLLRASRSAGWLASAVVIAGMASCAVGRTSTTPSVGHLRPGDQLARTYPELAGQVLPEVEPAAVAERVRRVAERQVPEVGGRRECTRYFPAGSVVLAVVSAFCDDVYGRDTDSRTILVVSKNGRLLETVVWAPVRGEAELVPYYRFVSPATRRP